MNPNNPAYGVASPDIRDLIEVQSPNLSKSCWPSTDDMFRSYQTQTVYTVLRSSVYPEWIDIKGPVPGSTTEQGKWTKLVVRGGVQAALRVYAYDSSSAGGRWLAAFESGHSFGKRILFIGQPQDIDLLDRDDDDDTPNITPGLYKGPFWEEDTDFRGRAPFGVGQAHDPAGVLIPNSPAWMVGTLGGEPVLTLSTADIPEHAHGVGHLSGVDAAFVSPSVAYSIPFTRTGYWGVNVSGGNINTQPTTLNAISSQNVPLPDGDPTLQTINVPHQSAGVGVYVLKRTIRMFHTWPVLHS